MIIFFDENFGKIRTSPSIVEINTPIMHIIYVIDLKLIQ